MALTTTFQPASSCISDIYSTTTGFLNYLSLGPPDSPECFPSGWEPTSQFFSPGICPSGYAVACQNINGGETQGICCPSSYSCQTSTNWPQYSTLSCTAQVTDLPSTVTAVTSGTSKVPIGLNYGGGVNTFGVSIRWKEKDFPTTATATATATATTAPETIATQQGPTSSSTEISQATLPPSQHKSDAPSEGLSTGAKAGIGVGAAAVALAIICLLFFYIKRYRQNKLRDGSHELLATEAKSPRDSKSGVWAPKHELYGEGENRMANNGSGPIELYSGAEPPELYSPGLHSAPEPVELDGETHRR